MALLRVSKDTDPDAKGEAALIKGEEADSDAGIPYGRLLVEFTEAALRRDDEGLPQKRRGLIEAIGEEGLVDSAAVIATFEANDRIADATGIQIDAPTLKLRSAIGEEFVMQPIAPAMG